MARLFEPLSRMSIETTRHSHFGNAPWQPRSIRNIPQLLGTQPRALFSNRASQLTSSKLFVPRTLKEINSPRTLGHGFRGTHSFAGPSSAIANTMRPLSQKRSTQGPSTRSPLIHRRPACTIFLLAFALSLTACASGPGGSSTTPPTPPITVTVAPNSGTVLLGNTLTFSATITNTSDTSVFWSVNAISGVTVSSDIAVSLSPVSSSVELGALQSFHASVASSGKPDTAIRWTLSGPACPNNCGAIDANGNYTAPAILPSAPSVTLTATSVADPSKQNFTTVTIASHFALQLAAPSSLQPGVTAAIVATLTPVPGSNPGAVLSWSLSGSGCSGSACGILSVITTQSAGGTAIADTANYTAPATAPQPNTIV